MPINIDPEFRSLLAPLSPEEYNQLQSNIEIEGCREPLVVWSGENILVDGHNRLEICNELGINFKTTEKRFPNREAAFNWIINNQLGRRNLKPEQVAYLRGKRYRGEKQQGQRNDLTSGQNEHKSPASERLAEEYGVAETTIRRDGKFSESIDTIAATLGEETKQAILTGEIKQPRRVIEEAAEMAKTQPEKAREIINAKPAPAKPRSASPIVNNLTLKARLGDFNIPGGEAALTKAIYECYGLNFVARMSVTMKDFVNAYKDGRRKA